MTCRDFGLSRFWCRSCVSRASGCREFNRIPNLTYPMRSFFRNNPNKFPSLTKDHVVKEFLSGNCKFRYENPGLNFNTNLNEVVKCLATGSKNVSKVVLYTLEVIFRMDCYKVAGLPVILFWTNTQPVHDEGRKLLVKMLNKLLENREVFLELAFPLLLSLFALTWAFGLLKDAFKKFKRDDSSGDQKKQDVHISLNDDQKRAYRNYLERLQIILEEICNNLSTYINLRHRSEIHQFNVNLGALQQHLQNFTQFVNPIIIDLEAKISKIQKEKKNRTYKAIGSGVLSFALIGVAVLVGNPFVRVPSGVVGGGSGVYSGYNVYKIYKLKKFINELEKVRDVLDKTQSLLGNIRRYVEDIFDPDHLENQSQQWFIIDQFKDFRNEVRKMRSTLPSVLQ